eukprot:TRINITY_DN15106_c0_g2_i3.p2 TRINITY_DN15106_c0_g2~~TRINITY_DN15106_c0_g2_i3.p2  ORF type:complete len:154 (+),score=32.90 TRINITY_DN15106_c0_g2_i3:84-545(+)
MCIRDSYKTDYTYFVDFGEYAKAADVPHYSVVSSAGASSTSCFTYLKVKGQADEAIQKLGFPSVSIFRPGLLRNRRNDSRCGEKVAGLIPCIDKIDVTVLAEKMMIDCVNYHFSEEKVTGATIPCTLRCYLSLIHICRCRRYAVCRSRWSPYH